MTDFYRPNETDQSTDSRRLQLDLKIDYLALSTEIIKQLRGETSQRQLSQELGFTFNQVGKWESGVTKMKWSEFIELCEHLNIHLEKSFKFVIQNQTSNSDANSYLHELISRVAVPGEVFSLFGSNPKLADVLQVLGMKSPYLFGWLSLLVNCQNLPSIKVEYDLFVKSMDVVFEDPMAVYVNAALHVEEYKKLSMHDDFLLADHATCTVEKTREILKILLNAHFISFDGKKYIPSAFDFSYSGLAHPKLRGLTKYTSQLTAERYPATPMILDPNRPFNPSRSSVRVKAMSREAAQRVSDLVSKFHNEVDEIVKLDSGSKENVQVILVHSFASVINSPFQTRCSFTSEPV